MARTSNYCEPWQKSGAKHVRKCGHMSIEVKRRGSIWDVTVRRRGKNVLGTWAKTLKSAKAKGTRRMLRHRRG